MRVEIVEPTSGRRPQTSTTVTAASPRPGQPRITVELTIDSEHLNSFYKLYVDAFGPLRATAVARQVLHRHEFMTEMTDPRIWKYVAWNEHHQPVALSTLTRHLDTVPWISPDYFAAHYPDHTARNAIYYWGYVLTAHNKHQPRLFRQLINIVIDIMVADNAVCAYDICNFNNTTMQLSTHIEKVAQRLANVNVESLDNQTYYGATFTSPR